MKFDVSLVFRNLFFTKIQPGVVGGLIPYWILGSRVSETPDNSVSATRLSAGTFPSHKTDAFLVPQN